MIFVKTKNKNIKKLINYNIQAIQKKSDKDLITCYTLSDIKSHKVVLDAHTQIQTLQKMIENIAINLITKILLMKNLITIIILLLLFVQMV
jgi:hypothetical protein